MTSEFRVCPKCGAEIPAPNAFGEGGCPGCLLQTGLCALTNEDERPPEPTPARHSKKTARSVDAGRLGRLRVTGRNRSWRSGRSISRAAKKSQPHSRLKSH